MSDKTKEVEKISGAATYTIGARDFNIINTPVHNIDGIAKVTGKAEYTFDIKLPYMLYGKILRSPYPHARILKIDASKAKGLIGVKEVVTGKDTLGVKQGIWRRFKELCDEEILTREKVRYIGEPVAVVAAVDEDTAEEALDLIEVDYEPLPAVFEPLDAIKEGAPQLHGHAERNINVTRHIEWGDVDAGFDQADMFVRIGLGVHRRLTCEWRHMMQSQVTLLMGS